MTDKFQFLADEQSSEELWLTSRSYRALICGVVAASAFGAVTVAEIWLWPGRSTSLAMSQFDSEMAFEKLTYLTWLRGLAPTICAALVGGTALALFLPGYEHRLRRFMDWLS
jgi:hypothetical protein